MSACWIDLEGLEPRYWYRRRRRRRQRMEELFALLFFLFVAVRVIVDPTQKCTKEDRTNFIPCIKKEYKIDRSYYYLLTRLHFWY